MRTGQLERRPTGNQPVMTRRQRIAILVVLLAAGVPLSACRGEVLAFDPASTAPPLTGSVVALSDEDALQLCNWLYATWPTFKPDPSQAAAAASPAPGYVAGPTFGCQNLPLFWVLLSPEECVLNLRHNACGGSVSDLEQCANYGAGTFWATYLAGGDACAGWSTACAPFLDAPGCHETVFQDSPGAAGEMGFRTDCINGLPVEPDVTCPAAGADAGGD